MSGVEMAFGVAPALAQGLRAPHAGPASQACGARCAGAALPGGGSRASAKAKSWQPAGAAVALSALALSARRSRKGSGRAGIVARRDASSVRAYTKRPSSFKGGLLIVCGPSGVGKSTLLKELLDKPLLQDKLSMVTSHTTRAPRQGEVDGVHYHFSSRDEMERRIARGEFLEYAEVHGNIYGTSLAAIDAAMEGGRICVLDIDLQGVQSVRQLLEQGMFAGSEARFVLLEAEGGLEVLRSRLLLRGSEDEESLQRRLETAQREIEEYSAHSWDRVVVNEFGNIEAGVRALEHTVLEVLGAGAGPVVEQEAMEAMPVAAGLVGRRRLAGGDRERAARRSLTEAVPEAPEAAGEPFEEVIASPAKSVFGEFSGLARQLGSAGCDLGQGFPNFDPPDFVVDSLRQELSSQTDGGPRTRHQYTRTAGHAHLVEVLAGRYSKHLGRTIDPLHEVAVTGGATGGLFLALQASLQRGGPERREVVALEPFFELYRSQASGLNAQLKTVPLSYDQEGGSFLFDAAAAESLRQALGPKTAALIVNTPHNPTGKAFSEEELLAIAEIVREHPDIVVISDEVYKYMIFDPPHGKEAAEKDTAFGHCHFAKLPGMWDQTITVSSAGKTFGITGWQIGWLVAPEHFMQPIQKFMPNLQFCAPTLMQAALGRVLQQAGQPYEGHSSYYAWLREDYMRRRKLMTTALEDVGIKIARSQGGFFLLADISSLSGPDGPLGDYWEEATRPDEPSDWAFCRALAASVGIVTLPVSPFFSDATPDGVRTRFARFCFAKTDATLDDARERLLRLKAMMPVKAR